MLLQVYILMPRKLAVVEYEPIDTIVSVVAVVVPLALLTLLEAVGVYDQMTPFVVQER